MLLQILTRTPPWVFPLFLLLMAIGLWMRRERTLPVVRAVTFPLAMLLLSALGAIAGFGASATTLAGGVSGMSFTSALGYRRAKPDGVHVDAERRTVTLPGSWRPLALMMIVFFLKYAVGVMQALRMPVTNAATFSAVVCFAYGALSAGFLWPLLVIHRISAPRRRD